MRDLRTLRELWQFIVRKRLYWLGLAVLVLLLLGLLLLTVPAPLAPFTYTLF